MRTAPPRRQTGAMKVRSVCLAVLIGLIAAGEQQGGLLWAVSAVRKDVSLDWALGRSKTHYDPLYIHIYCLVLYSDVCGTRNLQQTCLSSIMPTLLNCPAGCMISTADAAGRPHNRLQAALSALPWLSQGNNNSPAVPMVDDTAGANALLSGDTLPLGDGSAVDSAGLKVRDTSKDPNLDAMLATGYNEADWEMLAKDGWGGKTRRHKRSRGKQQHNSQLPQQELPIEEEESPHSGTGSGTAGPPGPTGPAGPEGPPGKVQRWGVLGQGRPGLCKDEEAQGAATRRAASVLSSSAHC